MERKNKTDASKPQQAAITPSQATGGKWLRSECSGEECVTCNKLVDEEGVQCQWCFNWEHRNCADLTLSEYNLLSKVFQQSYVVLFFVSS